MADPGRMQNSAGDSHGPGSSPRIGSSGNLGRHGFHHLGRGSHRDVCIVLDLLRKTDTVPWTESTITFGAVKRITVRGKGSKI